MSENRLDIHPDVLAVDILEITSFIMSDNPEAADAVLSSIDEAFVAVTSFPALGTLYHPGRRVLKGIRMIPATPYRIFTGHCRTMRGCAFYMCCMERGTSPSL
jgi:hypothetical protein